MIKPSTAVDLTPGVCTCSCGEATRGRSRFRQGHDQRLKGQLKRAHLADAKVELIDGGQQTSVTAHEAASRLDQVGHGWVSAVAPSAGPGGTKEDQEEVPGRRKRRTKES